jgi:CRISPR-associated protein Cas1
MKRERNRVPLDERLGKRRPMRLKPEFNQAIKAALDAVLAPSSPDIAPSQPAPDTSKTLESPPLAAPEHAPIPELIPARMLNEFVYCPRLFYYEFVEGVFTKNADTERGDTIHQRVDGGKGDMPQPESAELENLHSRSVTLGSERLKVIAKMDLIETQAGNDLFGPKEVCPVDYKAGAPREVNGENVLWDADKMQLGLQILILRDNGYTCNQGVIYYRSTKQRVPLFMDDTLEGWILSQIELARECIKGPIPPPLVDSPKCPRCSLVGICLPDETHMLAEPPPGPEEEDTEQDASPRRLIAPRADARALYLETQGLYVGCKGGMLSVKEKDKTLHEVRVNDIDHVALFGNIQISTQAVQNLCKAGVQVTYFSSGGWFYGITHGHTLSNVFLRKRQFQLAEDPAFCLRIAREIVRGKIANHRVNLNRNHIAPPGPVLAKLKNAMDTAAAAGSLDELLGVEGAAAALYFGEFAGMLKREGGEPSGWTFHFTHRNRRPPRDPVNALLSLAYSLLAKDCHIAALQVGFDPYIGFYHQPRFGRPALALDLMEEFRGLIAESAVVTAINNRMLGPEDFITAGQATNLSPSGRKKFFHAYEQRINSTITHPIFDYKVSYRRALELQARILARVIEGQIPAYRPFIRR